jgi:putative oxidoreductase
MKEFLHSVGLLWLRIIIGGGLAYHGFGKVFGGHMEMLIPGVAKLGFPYPHVFAWAAALSEFLGGILIVIGLFTRPAAFFVFVTMGVAFFMAHAKDPFQVKELAMVYGAVALALVLVGAGKLSVDGAFKKE